MFTRRPFFGVVLLAACSDSAAMVDSDGAAPADVSPSIDAPESGASPSMETGYLDSGSGDEGDRDMDSDDTADAPDQAESAKDALLGTDPFYFEAIGLEGDPLAVTEMRFIPGAPDEFLLLDKVGTVRRYRLQGSTAKLIGSFAVKNVFSDADCGLLSMAFDPGFLQNHVVYFGHCVSIEFSRITRFKLSMADGGSIDEGAEVITVGDATATLPWHNIGSMGFDRDGNLWAVFGDKVVTGSSQDNERNLGALIRIIPSLEDDAGASYTVPASNPYASDPKRSHALYAYGLRSPWRAALDSRGRYWIGDVGEGAFEEIDVVATPSQNLGWPMWEGPCSASCGSTSGPVISWNRTLTDPLALDDPRTQGDGRRVAWVGREYLDQGSDRYGGRLTGKMLYGDFCAGWVRAMSLEAEGGIASDERLAHLQSITSWDEASDGFLYATTYGGSCYAYPYQIGGMWRLRRTQ